jgi:hypothetical protein
MKTRSGFVSNSSSSSFVVARYKDRLSKKPEKVLPKDKEAALKKAGFVRSLAYYPDQVDMTRPARVSELRLPYVNWVKKVVCNQDDEIFFLLKNRISFVADIHYGHYTMIYDDTTDKLLIAQNFGRQAAMAGNDNINFKVWRNSTGIKYTTGSTYLKTLNI